MSPQKIKVKTKDHLQQLCMTNTLQENYSNETTVVFLASLSINTQVHTQIQIRDQMFKLSNQTLSC